MQTSIVILITDKQLTSRFVSALIRYLPGSNVESLNVTRILPENQQNRPNIFAPPANSTNSKCIWDQKPLMTYRPTDDRTVHRDHSKDPCFAGLQYAIIRG